MHLRQTRLLRERSLGQGYEAPKISHNNVYLRNLDVSETLFGSSYSDEVFLTTMYCRFTVITTS